jgi:hypothetical protein
MREPAADAPPCPLGTIAPCDLLWSIASSAATTTAITATTMHSTATANTATAGATATATTTAIAATTMHSTATATTTTATANATATTTATATATATVVTTTATAAARRCRQCLLVSRVRVDKPPLLQHLHKPIHLCGVAWSIRLHCTVQYGQYDYHCEGRRGRCQVSEDMLPSTKQ